MISTGRLVQALGGRGVLRERQATFEAIIAKARTGFPYAAPEALATRFEIPQVTLVRVLHLPPRTLARRKKARRLSAAESDRLLAPGPGRGPGGRRARQPGKGRRLAARNGPGARIGSPSRPARYRPRDAAGRADPRSHRVRRPQLIRVWRITRAKHAAFDGHGARRHGGRWNRAGTPVVYTSASLALAALELFVNLERPNPPGDLVAISADIPETLAISRVPPAELPPSSRSYPPPEALADLGTRWARESKSLVLAVPSAVIPQELNYLLNPLHSDFKRIRAGKPEAFRFDPRLRRR